MLSSKKLKPYIFLGGIFLSLFFGFALFVFSSQALAAVDLPTVSNLSTTSLVDTAVNIINAFLGLVGVIALGIFVYGGYLWMFSGGDPKKIDKAKKVLISAVIGLVIILISWAIVQFIFDATGGGGGGPGGACTEGAESGCYDCNGGSWLYDNTNAGCLFGDLFTVKWVDPVNGASDVPLCRIVQAGFSKNVNTTTVNSSNAIIQMSCTDNSECLNVMGVPNLGTCTAFGDTMCSGNIASLAGAQFNFFDALGDVDSDPDAFEFIPPAEWEKGRTYRIELSTGVTSASGTPLSATFVSTFSTGSTTDNTAPQVANIVPTPGGIDICRMKPISVVFNEPMRASTLKDMATLAVTEVELIGSKDYAALEFSKSDGTISPDGLTFSSSIPSPWAVNYSPKKPYDKKTEYFSILRAGEDIDGDKTLDAGEDLNGNNQLDGIQDACRNFLNHNQIDPNYGFSPKGDYGDYQGDGDDADVINYSFTTENSDDFQCDPEITLVETSPFYYDPPDPLNPTSDGSITIRGKNFGLAGDVLLKDSIAVSFGNNLCLEKSSAPSYTNTGRACVIPANWTDDRITLIAPARTQSGVPLGGTIDGPIQVDLGGFAECSGMPLVCQAGRNKDKTCGSDNDCPVGKSNLMAVDIASPHIFKMSPTAGPKGQWITLKGTDFGAAPGTVRFINTADRTQWIAGNFPCTASWSDTSIIVELPIDAAFNSGDILDIQIERSDGRHSNFGTFTVNGDPLGPGICALSESCGESGTLFNITGKRFGAAQGASNVIFKDTAETNADYTDAGFSWSDEAINNIKAPAALADGSYNILVRIPALADSNSLPFDKPCPGTPCDGDTIAPLCQPDQTICDAIGPTYSCDTTICRCVNNPLPKVVEQNSCTIGTQSPSPYINQTDACLNSMIMARFDKDMDDATLIKDNVKVDICNDVSCSTVNSVNITGWIFGIGVWDGNKEGIGLFPISPPLLTNTYYRVTLCSGFYAGICAGATGITSSDGYALDGDGDGVLDGTSDDNYSWIFKTSNDSCKVKSISTSPVNMSVAVLSAKPISAIPQAENCNTLNASLYNWVWTEADNTIATVSKTVAPNQSVSGVKAGTTTVNAKITNPEAVAISAGTSNITVTNKLSCSNAGLTAVWKFDEDSGSVALDSSIGGANNGTLNNSPARISSGCKFGKCLEFDGNNDYVGINTVSDSVFQNNFTVEAWVNFSVVNKAVDNAILGHGSMVNNKGLHLGEVGGKAYFGFFNDDLIGNTDLSALTPYHLAFVYNGSNKTIYVNGNLDTSGASNAYTGAGSNAEIGRYPWETTSLFSGSIDEVRIWNKALDVSEIKSIYKQQCEALDKIYCSNTNLKAVWKLDENSGIAANDSTANNNDGQLNSSPTWKDGADCKSGYGSCLSFDGVNDYIKMPDSDSISMTSAITMEAWIKTSDAGQRYIFSKHKVSGVPDEYEYTLLLNSGGIIRAEFRKGPLAGDYISALGTSNAADGNWHHIAATFDGNNIKIYNNGILESTTPWANNISSTVAKYLFIGQLGDDTKYFNGIIDEPRIWDKALTQEEIISAMSQECKVGGTGATLQCANDVVGVWNFDEGNGTLAADGSRNRNDGALMNGAAWNTTSCQFGGCLNFDGLNVDGDYVEIPDNSSLDVSNEVTVMLWANIENIDMGENNVLIDKMVNDPEGPFGILLEGNNDGNKLWGQFVRDDKSVIQLRPGFIPTTNQWHHYAITFKSGDQKMYYDGQKVASDNKTGKLIQNNLPINIGRGVNRPTYETDAVIDEVRIYNRALSATEIANTYQKSMTQCVEATLMCSNPELTAVWKMDEGIGVVAGDSTKNNLDGALKNGLNNTGWKSGVDCKFTNGKCLEFDGIDNAADGDYIRVPDSPNLNFGTGPFTIEGWVKMPTHAINGNIIGKQSGGGGPGFTIHTPLDGRLMFRASPGMDDTNREIWSSPVDDDAWHHFAAVREGTAIRIYIDGIRAGEDSSGTSVPEVNSSTIVNVNNDRPLYIGLYRNPIDDESWLAPFKGSLDELRIWKKALTDNQIQSIYNGGNGQQCLSPQKGSACDLDLVAPMCQPNVGLCESGDPDLRCSIKSCTCQEVFTVNPPPVFTYDSGGVVGGLACRNTAITVNFNENIDASTIKTAKTNITVGAAIDPGALGSWASNNISGTAIWSVSGTQLTERGDPYEGFYINPAELQSTTNYRISFSAGAGLLNGLNEEMGFVWNYQDQNNFYRLIWQDPTDSYASLKPSRLILQKTVNGTVSDLAVKDSFITAKGISTSLTIEVRGTNISVSSGSQGLLSYNDSSAGAIILRKVGFYSLNNPGTIFFNNLTINEIAPTITPGTVELYAYQPATGNLLADGDMERTDTNAWQTYGTPKVFEKSTGEKKGGSRSLRIETDWPFSPTGSTGEGAMSIFPLINSGDVVRVRGWVKVVKGKFIAALGDDQSGFDRVTTPITSNTWTEFSLDWNSVPTTGDMFLWASTENSLAPDSEFYVDDVSVTIERNLAVDIATRVSGSQLTISPRQFLDPSRNYTVQLRGDNLSALWNFDEGSGTTVKDWRGGNNGTLVGPPLWKSGADCKFGSCLEFDGNNNHEIEIAGSTGLNYQDSNAFTVQTWIKWNGPAGGNDRQYIWDSGHLAEPGYIIFLDENGNPKGEGIKASDEGETPRTKSLPLPSVGVWTNVAGVFDKSNGAIKIYINGILQDSVDWAPTANVSTTPSKIIGDYKDTLATSDYNFNGFIDDMRVWARALTDKEIADVANGGAPNPGNGNVIFSANGNPLENDYIWNGLTTGTEICKIGKAEIQFMKNSNAGPISYKGSDSFTCAGNACVDDMNPPPGLAGNQHGIEARVYSTNGGPLGGPMTYEWTKSTDAPFDIVNTFTEITAGSNNGTGTLYLDVDGGVDVGTAKASANVTVALCENPWPAVPPFQDVPAATSTNFSLWYCRDAGNMQDTTDDLPNLTVQEVTMSPGSPKPMKEYFYYDAGNTNDAIGIRVYANPGRLPLTEWLDQNANVSGGQSGMFNGWQSVKAGRSLYVSAMNDVGSGIYNNIYLISYSDKSSSTLIGIYNQMIGNWKFMVNGISDTDIAKLQRDIRRIDDLGKIATALDSYKTKNGSYPKLDAGTYLPGMSTSVWPSWQASFGNALQTSIPKDPINRLGNLNVWWKFDETTGMDIIDSGLNGYNGRMEGAIQRVSGGNCKFGGCLDFGDADQIDNVIRVPSEAANGLNDFTMDFWIKTNAEIGTVISGAKDVAGNNEFTVYWDNPNPGCDGLCPLLYTSFSHKMQPINDGVWHHIAWTKSGDASRVYIDGIWKDTKVIPGPIRSVEIPSGGLVIGQEQDDVGKSFEAIQSMKGLLDELRIWNRELSSSEIALLAAKGDADATGWNQDANSFRCDAGTDFDSHIYHYQYNNANSYNLYGALEYVGPIWPLNTQGNTWRQAGAPFPQPLTPYSCYNYKVGPISCSDPNLKAVWKLDENLGIVANDSTTNNNDGQLNNDPTRESADCKFGKCLKFDGNDDFVDIPNSSGVSYPAFSVEAWVYFSDNTQQERFIIGKHLSGINNGYFLGAWYNKINFYVSGALSPTRITTTEDFNGMWHHVAGVYGNDSMKLYIDGVEKASGSASGGISNSENVAIGSVSNVSHWQGKIDEPRIWDKALTQEEIILAMKQSCQ